MFNIIFRFNITKEAEYLKRLLFNKVKNKRISIRIRNVVVTRKPLVILMTIFRTDNG